MSRVRHIKPSFFKNEELAECSPYARLLFAGLWTIADREGRLEDRPKRIKADILPYDNNIDCEELLSQLAQHNFIVRYEAEGNKYIQILTFTDHQKPHQNEQPSTIPRPDLIDQRTTKDASENNQGNDHSRSNLDLTLTSNPKKDHRPVTTSAREEKPLAGFGSFQDRSSGPVGSGSGNFDVRDKFSEQDWNEISLSMRDYVHSSWDRKEVFAKYNAYVANDPPKKPKQAFIGWLKKNSKWLGRAP